MAHRDEQSPPFGAFERTIFGLIGVVVVAGGIGALAIVNASRPVLPEPPPTYMAGYHGCAAGVYGYAALVESCVNPSGGWRDLK